MQEGSKPMENRPALQPSLIARCIKRAILWWFEARGWTAVGAVPEPRKFVVIAAPHTSNWDFIYFIGAAHGLGARLSFMGKASLFRWPLGRMMRDMGGVPVDRTKSNNAVDATIAEFARHDEFMLTVAPEGTRHKVQQWKTGFYHIAVGAGVPLVCGFMCYRTKTAGLGLVIMPSGDYAKDMAVVAAFYDQFTAKYPDQKSVVVDQ
jgi:1-acyl-sn-glycerol-3-phosphate acyltransferase